jgi:hypothetical protein
MMKIIKSAAHTERSVPLATTTTSWRHVNRALAAEWRPKTIAAG